MIVTLFRRATLIVALSLSAPGAQAAPAAATLERVVMLVRHGVRVPLEGEVPDDTRTAAPWPRWAEPESHLTGHGARAMALLGRYDRARYARVGLFAPTGCPPAGSVHIHANTAARTIASGVAFADGFAPGCSITVDHLAADAVDPLFEPLRAGATTFDAATAVAAIDRYTGGAAALAGRHHAAIAELDRVLGCSGRCSGGGASSVRPSADGRGIDLTGPIRASSGTAQVLLLQYAQGWPLARVGWGRADAATLRRLGALHAALFDIFTRSPYMAAHQSAVFGRHMLAALEAPDAPSFDILVGHDTNVTALAAALHVDLVAPGYAVNDAAPGGALILERWRSAGGQRFVRVYYQAQPLAALRTLSPAVALVPVAIPDCRAPCPLPVFSRLLRARLAPLRSPASAG